MQRPTKIYIQFNTHIHHSYSHSALQEPCTLGQILFFGQHQIGLHIFGRGTFDDATHTHTWTYISQFHSLVHFAPFDACKKHNIVKIDRIRVWLLYITRCSATWYFACHYSVLSTFRNGEEDENGQKSISSSSNSVSITLSWPNFVLRRRRHATASHRITSHRSLLNCIACETKRMIWQNFNLK